MFREAVDAATRGEQERARELFTRLLRSDQANPACWLWMSTVVDSSKERIFCLQNVLRLEPENSSARLGLILLGAFQPEVSHMLAPPVRRKWIAPEEARPLKTNAVRSSKLGWIRSVLLVLSALFLLSVLLIGFFGNPFKSIGLLEAGQFTVTPRPGTPRPTATMLPTNTSAVITPKATYSGPIPLWMILEATYTPTPLYVDTPHPISEAYRAGLRSYQRGELFNMVKFMEQAARDEPDSPDTYYYLGEAHRFMNEFEVALVAYEQAIQVDENFAPAYLGRARILRIIDPNASTTADLDRAIHLDPNFSEAYLERAAHYLSTNEHEAALLDLKAAGKGLAQSPLLHHYLAEAYLESGQYEQGLEEAQTTNSLDQTFLPGYLLLGKAHLLTGNPSEARRFLEIYTQYEQQNAEAWVYLGRADYELGNRSSQAIKAFDRAIALQDDLFDAYLYRGLTYLRMYDDQLSVNDLFYARNLDRSSFPASLGLGRALFISGRYVEAVAQISASQDLAIDEKQLAEVYYWRAQAQKASGAQLAAAKDWQELLDLPSTGVPQAWKNQAQMWIAALTPTQTNTPTSTATMTRTLTPTATLARPTNTSTPPSRTLTPSPTPATADQRD